MVQFIEVKTKNFKVQGQRSANKSETFNWSMNSSMKSFKIKFLNVQFLKVNIKILEG